MKLSINANYFLLTRQPNRYRTIDESFALCKEAGFQVLDFSPFLDDRWEANANAAVEAAEKYGLVLEQSHAPYNFYSNLPAEQFSVILDRSIEAAIRMKNRQLVFHMDEYHAATTEEYDPEAALKSAYEALAPHVEKALAGGVRVALETIFEDRKTYGLKGRSHFGGTFEELMASIARFDHPDVGCCWDFGHASIGYGKEHCEMIRKMGKKIICTHTHDNYYNRDLHVLPFMGDLPWADLMRTMREIDYGGNLTFELVYGRLPDRLLPGFIKQTYDTGVVLLDMFEGKEIL
ncbi:MAG: sugar phosphate isomerase/epimerase [Clostridia bacterium]|nr:sugar phosphate isomerase/epimerase [Clostridia bacterium]